MPAINHTIQLASLSSSYTSSCDTTPEGIFSRRLCGWHTEEPVLVLTPCEERMMMPRMFVVEYCHPSPAVRTSAAIDLIG